MFKNNILPNTFHRIEPVVIFVFDQIHFSKVATSYQPDYLEIGEIIGLNVFFFIVVSFPYTHTSFTLYVSYSSLSAPHTRFPSPHVLISCLYIRLEIIRFLVHLLVLSMILQQIFTGLPSQIHWHSIISTLHVFLSRDVVSKGF